MKALSRPIFPLVSVSFVACFALIAGCSTSAVGDPCIPEQIPAGGFDPSQTLLETGSVQCATRVCIVDKLAGDPTDICGMPNASETCVQESEVEEKVFCSCRCNAPAGSKVPTCGCPAGFVCEEILQTGGDGLRGDYCVREPSGS